MAFLGENDLIEYTVLYPLRHRSRSHCPELVTFTVAWQIVVLRMLDRSSNIFQDELSDSLS